MPDLEMVRVGCHVGLFRPDNHAVALLNASAAGICEALLSDARTVAVMDDCSGEAAPLVSDLRKAGFLASPRVSSAVETSPRSAGIALPDAPTIGVYGVGDGPKVRLAVGVPELARLLDAVLQPLAHHSRARWACTITVVPAQNGLGVWRETSAIALDLAPADARRVALQAMLMALHGDATVAALLHASSVVMGDSAVVLAGATGSGKSTLALALAADGARWLADDFTALDASGMAVRGFPVAASVKQGSWPLIGKKFPELANCAAHAVGDRTVRYLDPARRRCDSEPWSQLASIGVLIFPRYAAGGDVRSARLSPEAALGRLLASGSEAVGWPRSLGPMAQLVNDVPAWELVFDDLDAGVTMVGRLAQNPDGSGGNAMPLAAAEGRRMAPRGSEPGEHAPVTPVAVDGRQS